MYFFIYWLVFLIAIIGTLLIILAVHQSRVSNTRKNQENINSKANNSLRNSNFKITKKFYLNDYATYDQLNNCKKFIAVDNDNKQICLIDYEKGSMLIVEFNEILNYEVYENGSNATTGGGIGGFWSGIFGAETNGMCKDLKLIIRLNRYDTSQVSYEIISNTSFNMGINKSTKPYKQCISTIQEVISFLEVVKNENQTHTEKDTSV
ncbi:MAG: hypothetical protein IJA61_00320 [Clostridia bacterium]|nr:hypothetical protein [Clostridia bacterium]